MPVLSKTTADRFRARSSTLTFLMRMPSRAAALNAATIAVGVARMMLLGHAITSSAIARGMSLVNSSTITAIISTTGVWYAA